MKDKTPTLGKNPPDPTVGKTRYFKGVQNCKERLPMRREANLEITLPATTPHDDLLKNF